MKHLIPLAVLVMFVSGCPSVQQPAPSAAMREVAGGTIEHAPSGMQFPLSRGGFTRVGVRQYDAAGVNVSTGYNSTDSSAPIAITVYLYPSPPIRAIGSPDAVLSEARVTLTRGEFQRAKSEILQVHPGGTLVGEEEVPPPGRAMHRTGYFARFAFSENFAGAVRPVESLLYVYCYVGENWTVKYRVTYPATSLEARTLVNQFIQDLPWTVQKPNKAPEPTSTSVTPPADAGAAPAAAVAHL